ncbi:MAG TPA: spore maturation protein [Clostridiales bacterium]|nr:spore maturation protein [Clostridiales bacterium]
MDVIEVISKYLLPLFISTILIYGYTKGVDVYSTFIEGAEEGITTAIRIMPYLVTMFIAIGIFRTSGAMDIFVSALTPLANIVGIPSEILPLVVMRPISGMASLGIVAELFSIYGADSFIGRVASTAMGSSETILYTLSIYFGSIGIKNTRYTLIAAFIAEFAGFIAAVAVCKFVFA